MDWFLYGNGLRHERVKNDEENKWKDLQTEMEYLEGKLPKVVIPAFGSSP